jgi:hypothetical protein
MKTNTIIAALLFAAGSAFAQVPSYVPTNGLVGWWPFNGNANDESGNGNNGMVNGALITTDRFGCNNESYFLRGPILLLSQILQLLIYGLGDFIFISNNSRSMHKYFV